MWHHKNTQSINRFYFQDGSKLLSPRFFKEHKHVVKENKMTTFINDEMEMFFDNSDGNISDEE